MLKLGHKSQALLSSNFRGHGSSPGTFSRQIIYTSGPCFALEDICVNIWLLLLYFGISYLWGLIFFLVPIESQGGGGNDT